MAAAASSAACSRLLDWPPPHPGRRCRKAAQIAPRRLLFCPHTRARRRINRSSNPASTAPAAIAIPGASRPAPYRKSSAPKVRASSPTSGSPSPRRATCISRNWCCAPGGTATRNPASKSPIGDFFGLNLGTYFNLPVGVPGLFARQIAELLFRHAVPPVGAPHRHQRRQARGGRVLFQHRLHDRPALPDDALYFHAQYRQAAPCSRRSTGDAAKLNLDGRNNYVYAETRGRGHLMGVTLGVLQNADRLVGRRRRHDFRRRRIQARSSTAPARRITSWAAGISAAATAPALWLRHVRRAADRQRRTHRRPLLLLPLARR